MSLLDKLMSLVSNTYSVRLSGDTITGSKWINCLLNLKGRGTVTVSRKDSSLDSLYDFPAIKGYDSLSSADSSPDRTASFSFIEGDMLLLPPGITVAISNQKDISVCVIAFDPETLLDLMDCGNCLCTVRVFDFNHPLNSALRNYARHTLSNNDSLDNPNREDDIFQILKGFLRMDEENIKHCIHPAKGAISPKTHIFLENIFLFIYEHLREDLSLNSISAHFQVTAQYFASLFKRQTGYTFHQYIQKIRCEKGLLYARLSDLCDETISARVHLEQVSVLSRYLESQGIQRENAALSSKNKTKKNGYSPSLTYLPSGELQDIPGAQIAPERTIGLLDSPKKDNALNTENASRTVRAIHVDVHKWRSFNAPWNKLINLGYAPDFLKNNYTDLLKCAHSELHIRYGRICRLFDLITKVSFKEETRFDFSLVFYVIDQIIESDMLPHIELSNKLFRIQLDPSEIIPLITAANFTEYFNRMVKLMPEFVQACINHYGLESFKNWQFEFSYSLDDMQMASEEISAFIYTQYFRRIRNCIKSFCSQVRIGAPGFNFWKNPQRFSELLRIFENNDALPDFATAYIYPVDLMKNGDAGMAISPDEAIVEKRIRSLYKQLRSHFNNMELWITEFNSNLSSRNFLNDSSYQAAFLVRHMTGSAATMCHAIGYYMLSDIPLRFSDNLDFLFGGWGLITDTGIPKPSWHAFSMLSMLGEQIVKSDRNVIITRSSDRSYQCLLYHYEHVRQEASFRNLSREDFELPESIFEEVPSEYVTISLKGMLPGIYLVKQMILNGSKSDILYIWREAGYKNLEDYYNLHALRMCSGLIPKISTIELAEGEALQKSILLRYNEVHLFLIDRL